MIFSNKRIAWHIALCLSIQMTLAVIVMELIPEKIIFVIHPFLESFADMINPIGEALLLAAAIYLTLKSVWVEK